MITPYDKEIQEINIGYALEGPVLKSLIDILPALTKSRLSGLASEYEITGRSKMNKAELVSSLLENIMDVKNIEYIILIAYLKELRLFEKTIEASVLKDTNIVPGDYLYLMNKGLIFSFFSNGELSFVIPNEIKAAYKKINKGEFSKIYERYQLIYNYICSLANLYGIFKPELLLEIFNFQNTNELTHIELMRTYWHLSSRHQLFYMHKGYFASDYFDYKDAQGEFEELEQRYERQNHYIPEKEELLKYADDLYYEVTPQLIGLKNHIIKNICNNERLVDELVNDIQLVCSDSWQFSMQHIFYEFERRNISFKNQRSVEQLMPYIMEVVNNTRLWINGGNTPVEVKPPAYNQIAVAKIGRNEACPCGSGKKYKKCCGSN